MLDKATRRRLVELAERNEKLATWPLPGEGAIHCTAKANAQIAADIREALAECDIPRANYESREWIRAEGDDD